MIMIVMSEPRRWELISTIVLREQTTSNYLCSEQHLIILDTLLCSRLMIFLNDCHIWIIRLPIKDEVVISIAENNNVRISLVSDKIDIDSAGKLLDMNRLPASMYPRGSRWHSVIAFMTMH